MYIRGTFGVAVDGNVVDKTITDTYTLSVTAQGRLTATLTTTSADNSKNLNVDAFSDFFGGEVNRVAGEITNFIRNAVTPRFADIPLAVVQDFVFPGGRTFAFKNVAFSGNQDLVSHITYADPV
jgi:hypothetical protein